MEPEAKAAAVCCCASVTVVIFLVTSCFKVVLPTEVAVEYNWVWKSVKDEALTDPGLYVRGPWKSFITYPKTVESLTFDERHKDLLDGRTLDGLPIVVGVTLQYQLLPEEVVQLYKEFEYQAQDYLELFKLHAIHIITEEACNYNAAVFFNDKIKIASNMKTAMDKHFRARLHARVDALQLNSEALPDAFTTTVLNASAMRQNITKAENTVQAQMVVQATNVIVAKQEAKMMIWQANGSAAKITNDGEADAKIIETFADAERDMYGDVRDKLELTPDELLAYIWYDAVGDGNTVQTGDGLEVFAGINPGAYIKQ